MLLSLHVMFPAKTLHSLKIADSKENYRQAVQGHLIVNAECNPSFSRDCLVPQNGTDTRCYIIELCRQQQQLLSKLNVPIKTSLMACGRTQPRAYSGGALPGSTYSTLHGVVWAVQQWMAATAAS